MKKLYYLLVIISFGFLSGCEKVIDIDLNSVTPKLVIEANLNDATQVQTVKISKTYDFNDPNKFNFVTGASVVMTSNDGQTVVFTENKPGIYESLKFRGRPGITYTMKVTAEGKTYTAVSMMPVKVGLVALSFRTYTFLNDDKTYVVAHFKDPKLTQNQYRYVLKYNTLFQDDFVSEDRFDDGNEISNVLYSELKDVKANDVIEVELQCIDRNVFKYYFAIEQSSGKDGPPVSPANPDSNFDNGALGVFSAYTSSRMSVVIH